MNILNDIRNRIFSLKNKGKVEKGVKRIIYVHGNSLKKLELYDKGEIPLSKDVVEHRDLRSYVQSLSKNY